MPAGTNIGTVWASIKLDTSGLTTGIQTAKRQFQDAGSFVTKNLADIENAGRRLSLAITAPLLGAGIASAKFGMDFGEAIAKIVGLAGAGEGAVDGLRKSILAMSPEVAKSPKELADAMFFIYSAGIRGAAAVDVLHQSAKAASAGLGQVKDVADAVTSAVNAYGPANITAAQATDALVAAVREGKVESTALAGAIGKVLPIAANMGISFQNVAAAMATMTRSGLNADEAAVAVRQTLANLVKPAKSTRDALASVGLTAAQVRQELSQNLIQGLSHLANAFKGNDEALARVFPNIRALIGVLNLTGQNAAQVAGIFDRVTNSAGATDSAFKDMEETTGYKFKSALEGLQVAMIKLGDAAGPAIEKASAAIKGFSAALAGIGPTGGSIILAVGAIVASIGPLLMAIAGIKTAIATLGITSATLGTVFSGPVLLAILAVVGAIAGGVAIYRALNKETKDAVAEAEKNARANYDQAAKVKGLVGEYKRLNPNTDKARDILQKIAELNPNLIRGFDKQGRPLGLIADAWHKIAWEAEQAYQKEVKAAQALNVRARTGLMDDISGLHSERSLVASKLHTGKQRMIVQTGLEGGDRPMTQEEIAAYRQNPKDYGSGETSLSYVRKLTDAEKAAASKTLPNLDQQIAEKQKAYDALVPAGKSLAHGKLLEDTVKIGSAPPRDESNLGPSGLGGKGKKEKPKTAQELADERAQAAMDWIRDSASLSPDFGLKDQLAGLDRITRARKEYAAMSRSTEAQVADERKRVTDEIASKEKEAADQVVRDQQAAADRELEITRATGDQRQVIDAEYEARKRELLQQNYLWDEAEAIASAERRKKISEIEKDAADKRKQAEDDAFNAEMKRLDWEYEHNLVNLTQYVTAIKLKMDAEKEFSDRWYELRGKLEQANADGADRFIVQAELVGNSNKQAAIDMLNSILPTYRAMGTAGVAAAKKIEDAIQSLEKEAAKPRKATGIQKMLDDIKQQAGDVFVTDLTNAFMSWIDKSKNGVDAFKSFWKQFLLDIVALAIQQMAKMALIKMLPALFTFDDPINDTRAVRSGSDFARLFRQGMGAELGLAFPRQDGRIQPAQARRETHISMPVTVNTYADKIVGIDDIEAISDRQAWVISRKLKLAPTG